MLQRRAVFVFVIFCLSLFTFLILSCNLQRPAIDAVYDQVRSAFNELPDSTKPWVYWYWLSDHISKKGISEDLKMMNSLGIGTALIGNVFIDNIERGRIPVLSEAWYDHLQYALHEAENLGMDIGIFNGPGWVQSGGPWIDSTMAMRYLTHRDTLVERGSRFKWSDFKINDGQPVALFAYPQNYGKKDLPQWVKSDVGLAHPEYLLDDNLNTDLYFSNNTADSFVIEMEWKDVQNFSSIQFVPSDEPFYIEYELSYWQNGNYTKVAEGEIDRSNNMLTVGPMIYGPVIKSFSSIKSMKWRIVFSHLNKNKVWFTDVKRRGGLKEIIFSELTRVDEYVEKQLGKMHQLPSPGWYDYQWSTQLAQQDTAPAYRVNEMVNLSFLLDNPDSSWTVPEGNWIVYSLAMLPTGVTNAPVSPEGLGFDVDKMNEEYVFEHFENYLSPLLNRLNEHEREALKYLVIDSYETGSQNWTDGFRERFKERYQYDPLPWLPIIAGDVVESSALSDRFLWDLRRLVADEISDQYVAGLQQKARENSMKLWVENYGHWGFPGEFLQYGGRADLVAGEFWLDDPLGEIECRAAASAGHIYGKKAIFAEAFTAPRKHFSRYPEQLRKRGDWSYAQGINHHVLHVYVHQPYQDTFPGINTWFGVEFNRQNIWFPQSKSWIDYLRRNHFLLQQGNYQADVCYFIGEGAPLMTGIEDPRLPGGYAFDFINAEVILHDVRVVDHRIVLPDGMSYALMVLPPLESMTPELIVKLETLVQEGAYLVGNPPDRSPSLNGYPNSDQLVQKVAAKMWSGPSVEKQQYGKGLIFRTAPLQNILDEIGVPPDMLFTGDYADSLLWLHRNREGLDIYFITNQSNQHLDVEAEFRIANKYPELWDAVTGEQRPLYHFKRENNRTQINLQFNPGESYYVVFSNIKPDRIEAGNFPSYSELIDLSKDWVIEFDPELHGPKNPIRADKLFDWSEAESDSIHYYSGTAVYSKEFDFIPNREQRYFLSLGDLCAVANIILNGQKVGGVWTKPAALEISDYLQPGKNSIKVEVTNTWVNRMIGDRNLPEAERLTWASENPFRPDDLLQPSGMLGPVKLLIRSI